MNIESLFKKMLECLGYENASVVSRPTLTKNGWLATLDIGSKAESLIYNSDLKRTQQVALSSFGPDPFFLEDNGSVAFAEKILDELLND